MIKTSQVTFHLRPSYLRSIERMLEQDAEEIKEKLQWLERYFKGNVVLYKKDLQLKDKLKINIGLSSSEKYFRELSHNLNTWFKESVERFVNHLKILFPYVNFQIPVIDVVEYEIFGGRADAFDNLHRRTALTLYDLIVRTFDMEDLDKPANVMLGIISQKGINFVERTYKCWNDDVIKRALEKGILRGWISLTGDKLKIASPVQLFILCPRCRSKTSNLERYCSGCGLDLWLLARHRPLDTNDKKIIEKHNDKLRAYFTLKADIDRELCKDYKDIDKLDKEHELTILLAKDEYSSRVKASVFPTELHKMMATSGLATEVAAEDSYYSVFYSQLSMKTMSFFMQNTFVIEGNTEKEITEKLDKIVDLIRSRAEYAIRLAKSEALEVLNRHRKTLKELKTRYETLLKMKEENGILLPYSTAEPRVRCKK